MARAGWHQKILWMVKKTGHMSVIPENDSHFDVLFQYEYRFSGIVIPIINKSVLERRKFHAAFILYMFLI